jgi:signal transduction histidine kinase
MDYTTRKDGSGLGLFIARSLIESQGGRVYVEASHILWGTTMAVELPYRI